jgi:ribonuclease D
MHSFSSSGFPIVFIQSDDELNIAVDSIALSKVVSLDTEYDSFKRQYGFNMLLIQIFDLTSVYIIDPLTITDYSSLWRIFENPDIEKVLYSGSEDIALLKQHGCNIKNVFDVQVAATLSNHPARNLGDLLLAETGRTIDKSEQTSDWSVRPLSAAKIEYAANDVIFLPEIKEKLKQLIDARDLHAVLEEENLALEKITERSHVPKIKPSYYKDFSKSFCDALLAMLNLRDQIGKDLNIPPNRVVDNRYLEDALFNRDAFLTSNEFKSFHPKVRYSQHYKNGFIDILRAYDPESTEKNPRMPSRNRRIYSKDERNSIVEEIYNPVKATYLENYGERTTEFLLRGMKRKLISGETSTDDLRMYQRDIFTKLSAALDM